MEVIERSLDDLYEEISNHVVKIKPSLKKSLIFSPPIILGDLDPKLYLLGIPSVIQLYKVFYNFLSIVYKSEIRKEENVYNSLEYLNLEKNYFILINELQKALKDISIEEPMQIFATYYYLVLNGYLSINHNFKANNIDDFPQNLGSCIVSGEGVCRNLSSFLTDLLRKFDYESYTVEMYIGDSEIEIFRMTDEIFNTDGLENIQRTILNNYKVSLYFNKLFNKYFDHMSTLLVDNDKSYIMDPMNNTFYLVNNGKVYPYHEFVESIKTELKKEWTDRKVTKLPKVTSSGITDVEELLNRYMVARLKCDDYIPTFEKFYLEHRELYKEILANREEFSKKNIKINYAIKQIL